MTLKALRELRDAAPFKAFDLELADGRTLPVVTPDHLFFMPDAKELFVVLPDNGFRFVDLAQVVSAGRNAARAKARETVPLPPRARGKATGEGVDTKDRAQRLSPETGAVLTFDTVLRP